MNEVGDGASDIEDAQGPKTALNEGQAEFEGPELNPFSIDDVARDMNGHYDGNGEDSGGEVMANIDLDFEANPDSDIDEIELSDADIK